MTKGQASAMAQKYIFESNVTEIMKLLATYPELEASIQPAVRKMLNKADNINEQLKAMGLDVKVEIR